MTREEMFVHLNALKHITDESSMMWLALDMAIKELGQNTKEIYNKGFADGQKALAEHLKLCKEEKGWIPVSERLPEKNGKHNTFLVTDHDGNLSISKFYLPLSNSDIEKPYWSGMIDVIAWMPLPEPYKAESEDKE